MGGEQGRLIPHCLRCEAVKLIDEAVASGARQAKACEILDISARTLQRWKSSGDISTDGRPDAIRPTPSNSLTKEEKQQVLDTLNAPDFANMPPSQVVPRLADDGVYLCSESSMYRILHEAKQQNHRGRSKAPEPKPASTHCADGPNQVWCWDITWLPGPAKGVHFYLYLILDIFSRKIVGWEIHEQELADHASRLLRKACMKESTVTSSSPLVLHSDNGSPMKGSSMLETMYSLGVVSSFNRPRVSNDNAYAESIFRTCKYRPDYPYQGFEAIKQAREWVLKFVSWYNHEHRHSGIKFVTPHQRHTGQDEQVLARRTKIYEKAKLQNPERWSGNTRDWSRTEQVWLNPNDERAKLDRAI